MVNPSEGLSNKYFGENNQNANNKEVLGDINKNNKLEVDEIEQIISTDLEELQSEIDNSVVSDQDLKTTKEKFMKNFQTARYVNIRPNIRTNLGAMNQDNFLDELKNFGELNIDGQDIDVSKVTDPYLGVKILLSYLGYTGINGNKLDLTNTSYYPGRILTEQKDLYIALLKFQNLNYGEESRPQSSYLGENKDEGTEGKADGIIGGLTLRGLIQDVKNKNIVKPTEEVESEPIGSNTTVDNDEETKVKEKKSEEESYIENNNENKEEADESIIENDNKKEDVIGEVPNEETNEESLNIKVEKIGDRKFPRLRDVYKHGNEKYLFDKNDLSDRGLSDKIDYIPSMYKSLNLDRNLDNPIESEDLKEFLIKPWFKQLDKVIDDMEDGISIDGEKYKFTPEQIKEAIKNEGFIKTIKKDGKEYEIVFDTWTPEMKKISNSVRPLGDKEYQKTEGKSGSVKEKYQIEPVGLIYNKVNGIFNTDKKIGKISVGNRVLKQTN
ncbi:MAG TPA: hypothetical protein VJ892_03815 [Candidatus Absconditabacterales bacterium]|nr:hypothetical protein [Candidatus Absconditabacterales bacterium]